MRYLLLILLSLNVFSYTQDHIKINSGSYYRYIRPQIRSILADYKRLLQELEPKLREVSSSMDLANDLYEMSVSEEKTSKEDVDKKLELMIKTISQVDLKKKSKLEKALVIARSKNSLTLVDLKNLYNEFNFFILENLDVAYRDQFNLLWIDYISPIYREIALKNNINFLKLRLTSLNFAWNSFNVHMTKRDVDLPKGVATRLELIHRRWRSVLKLCVVP